MEQALVGTCLTMCPERQAREREDRRELSVFEIITEDVGKPLVRGFKPRVCLTRAVKKYERPAALQAAFSSADIRPPDVLLQTTRYLIEHVLVSEQPLHVIYSFISDRMRSIRQDFSVQRIFDERCVASLEWMSRFYVLMHYRLCDAPLSEFDPQMNQDHLNNCLITLLDCYRQKSCPSQAEFHAYHLLSRLHLISAVAEAMRLSAEMRQHPCMRLALEAALALHSCNYVRFGALFRAAPPLASCLLHAYIPIVRQQCIAVFSKAVLKTERIPIHVWGWLLVHDERHAVATVSSAGLQLLDGSYVTGTATVAFRTVPSIPEAFTFRGRSQDAIVDEKLATTTMAELVLPEAR